ncbi:glycosyl hydrolase family 71 protein [Colletotrichum incanum]|nr:glycosyl hydrolase family 71 protein [Colletotrichum incanum]
MNDKSVKAVFAKAEQLGFQLFFSFEYAGNGPWKKQVVIEMLQKYRLAFRSTFESPAQADDWVDIKAQTGCFFVPDWSFDGARRAMERAGGVADGLFSWDAWPWGGYDMDTYTDASYNEFLGGKPYMMPVSPWFYTNMPGFGKNWLWRGDHAWYDRWVQVNWLQPEWVQIISWNNYGESHHIGPIRDHALVAFKTGKFPYNYALDRPYGAWRTLLPFTIDSYKHNTATITQEGVEFWYRRVYRKDCNDGGTTGSTASQVQLEYKASDLVSDEVFFSALLTEEAESHVFIGGSAYKSTWRNKPEGGAGIYHGAIYVTGPDVGRNCGSEGYHNFNPTTGGKMIVASRIVTLPSLSNQICIEGWGTEFEYPNGTGPPGYALEGRGSSYVGLCSSACSYGICPEEACGLTQHPLIEPIVSPFQPPVCVSGTGPGDLAALCSFTCRHGYCPIAACTCSSQGELDWLDPTVDLMAGTIKDDGHGLCAFACSRGYCPFDKCVQRVIEDQGSEDDEGPSRLQHLHKPTRSTPASKSVFRLVQNDCRSTTIEVLDRTTMSSQHVRDTYDTEHNPDGQYIRDFVRTMTTGILPNGSTTTNGPMDGPDLVDNWNADVLPATMPRAGSSKAILTPNGYLFDRLGSQGNRFPLLLCECVMNQVKGRIYNLRQPSPQAENGGNAGSGSGSNDNDPNSDVGERPNPMGEERFETLLLNTLRGNVTAQNDMFEGLRMAIGIFRYINHPDALPTVQRNHRELRIAVTVIAGLIRPLSDAAAIQREFDSNRYREGADRTRAWVAERILDIRLQFGQREQDGNLPPNAATVQGILDDLADQIHYIQPPPDI